MPEIGRYGYAVTLIGPKNRLVYFDEKSLACPKESISAGVKIRFQLTRNSDYCYIMREVIVLASNPTIYRPSGILLGFMGDVRLISSIAGQRSITAKIHSAGLIRTFTFQLFPEVKHIPRSGAPVRYRVIKLPKAPDKPNTQFVFDVWNFPMRNNNGETAAAGRFFKTRRLIACHLTKIWRLLSKNQALGIRHRIALGQLLGLWGEQEELLAVNADNRPVLRAINLRLEQFLMVVRQRTESPPDLEKEIDALRKELEELLPEEFESAQREELKASLREEVKISLREELKSLLPQNDSVLSDSKSQPLTSGISKSPQVFAASETPAVIPTIATPKTRKGRLGKKDKICSGFIYDVEGAIMVRHNKRETPYELERPDALVLMDLLENGQVTYERVAKVFVQAGMQQEDPSLSNKSAKATFEARLVGMDKVEQEKYFKRTAQTWRKAFGQYLMDHDIKASAVFKVSSKRKCYLLGPGWDQKKLIRGGSEVSLAGDGAFGQGS